MGPPIHYHLTQDEWFFVLAGDHEFLIGSERYHVQAGGSVLGPRMVPHTWQNIGTVAGRLLALAEPAGELEEFFVEFSKLISEGHPDSGEVAELFARYDMKVVGPSLKAGDSLERFLPIRCRSDCIPCVSRYPGIEARSEFLDTGLGIWQRCQISRLFHEDAQGAQVIHLSILPR